MAFIHSLWLIFVPRHIIDSCYIAPKSGRSPNWHVMVVSTASRPDQSPLVIDNSYWDARMTTRPRMKGDMASEDETYDPETPQHMAAESCRDDE